MRFSELRWWQKAGFAFLVLCAFSVFVHQAQAWSDEARQGTYTAGAALALGAVLLLWGRPGKVRIVIGWLFIITGPLQLWMALNPLTADQKAAMAAEELKKNKTDDGYLSVLCEREFKARANFPETVEFRTLDPYRIGKWDGDVFDYQAAPSAKNAFGVPDRRLMRCRVRDGKIISFVIGNQVTR